MINISSIHIERQKIAVLNILKEVPSNEQISLRIISVKAKLPKQDTEIIIRDLLKEFRELGKYYELEQTFIRLDSTSSAIDDLLRKYETTSKELKN